MVSTVPESINGGLNCKTNQKARFNTSNLPAVVTKEYDDICNDIHPIWYYLAS